MARRYMFWCFSEAFRKSSWRSSFWGSEHKGQGALEVNRGEGGRETRWGGLTLWDPFIMACTKAVDSLVQERTVSVRPSRNILVIEASYVRQNLPLSWGTQQGESSRWTLRTPCTLSSPQKLLPGNEPAAGQSAQKRQGWSDTS